MSATETTIRFAAIVMLPIVILAVIPAAAEDADIAGAPGIRMIQVDGHGEVRAKPDTAELNVAIETHATTAEQCASLNASLAQKVSEALKAKLGDKGKIETGGYSLYPEYEQRPGREKPSIIGYRAENSIMVETRDIDVVGQLIDTATGAGANQINSLNFILKDDTKARAEAIAKAARDAQVQANALATSLGVKLKRIHTATTTGQIRPVPVFAAESAMASMARRAPTPVEPGEVTVPAQVSLTYEIE
jgi:uncharacterized protein